MNVKLESTVEYDQFKMREDNRDISPTHVARLVESIKEFNDLELHPIIVNDSFEVIDGQHRLAAAKALQIPVYYVVDTNFAPKKMVIINTTQKKWGPQEYLNYYIKHGHEDYVKLKDFQEKTGLPIYCAFVWVNHRSERRYNDFKEGRFKFNLDPTILTAITHAKNFMEELTKNRVKPAHIVTSHALHSAMKQFFTHHLIDPTRFFERYSICPFVFRYCTTAVDFLENLIEIYNYDYKKNRLSIQKNGLECEIVG